MSIKQPFEDYINTLSDPISGMNKESNQSKVLTQSRIELSNEKIKSGVNLAILVSKKSITLRPTLIPSKWENPKMPKKTSEMKYYYKSDNDKNKFIKSYQKQEEKAGEEKYGKFFLEDIKKRNISFIIKFQNNNFEPIDLNEKVENTSTIRKDTKLGHNLKERKDHRDKNENQNNDTDIDEPTDIENRNLKEKEGYNEEIEKMQNLKDNLDKNILKKNYSNNDYYEELKKKMDEKGSYNLNDSKSIEKKNN